MKHLPSVPRPVTSVLRALGALGLFAAAAGAAENSSAEIDGLIRLGDKVSDRGDGPTAEIAYWQVLHRTDATVAQQSLALLGVAHVYRKEGALTKASAIYERFLKDRSDDDHVPDALLELGRTLRDMGAYRLALNRFYSVINSTLKFPPQGFEHYQRLAKTAQFEIAQTHFEAGEYDEAGRYFLKVRLLDLAASDRARAHFMAAFSQQLAGQREEAITTLKGFLEAFPNDINEPEARYLLATTLRQLNRSQEAMTVTLGLLQEQKSQRREDPRRWVYWQRRTGNQVANELFQSGDIFNALAIYQGLVSLSTDTGWRLPIQYQIGLCFDRLGQLDQARAAYQAVEKGGDTELAHMASWRLAHLDWRDKTERQFTTFFRTGLPHDPAPSSAATPTDVRRSAPSGLGGESIPAAAPESSGRPPA